MHTTVTASRDRESTYILETTVTDGLANQMHAALSLLSILAR
jgi:hypothetical protein